MDTLSQKRSPMARLSSPNTRRAVVEMMDLWHTVWSRGVEGSQDWWITGSKKTDLSSRAGAIFTQPGKMASSRHLQVSVTRHAQSEAHSQLGRLSQETGTTGWHLHRSLKVPPAPAELLWLYCSLSGGTHAFAHESLQLSVLGAGHRLSLVPTMAHLFCLLCPGGLFLLHMPHLSECPLHPKEALPVLTVVILYTALLSQQLSQM